MNTTAMNYAFISPARRSELLLLPAEQRLAAVRPGELIDDCFCKICGVDIRGDGYAQMKAMCREHAWAAGEACSACGCDAGNGAGGYSNCCGAPLNGIAQAIAEAAARPCNCGSGFDALHCPENAPFCG